MECSERFPSYRLDSNTHPSKKLDALTIDLLESLGGTGSKLNNNYTSHWVRYP